MKKIYIILFFITGSIAVKAQEIIPKNEIDYELGKGLSFDFNDQAYRFRIGGFVQPLTSFEKTLGSDYQSRFQLGRAHLLVIGEAAKEKLSFMFQTDFTQSNPLLDAWIGYSPIKNVQIAVGQKRSPLNNREMLINEDKYQFTHQGILSNSFTDTGREFGAFVSSKFFLSTIGIAPQLAATSGDGRNSFGSDSRDADKGGWKYGGRLDIYPTGYFKNGNENTIVDLEREERVKIVLGGAFSLNKGASHQTGEGHGAFRFFNSDKMEKFPDYKKLYADVLLKYNGFSLLGEFVNATASNLNGLYTNEAITDLLQPKQISNYLVLGNAYNVQTGYVTKNGFAIDLRYSKLLPEFTTEINSILKDTKAYQVGLSKYLKGNDVKIQSAVSRIDISAEKRYVIDAVIQLSF